LGLGRHGSHTASKVLRRVPQRLLTKLQQVERVLISVTDL
jgi:hypothetical protein